MIYKQPILFFNSNIRHRLIEAAAGALRGGGRNHVFIQLEETENSSPFPLPDDVDVLDPCHGIPA